MIFQRFQRVFSAAILTAIMAFLLVFIGPGTAQARSGKASYYIHSSAMITAANEPIGSVLCVTNPQNGRSITVRVVGSGPFVPGRVLDLSTGAFSQLYGGTGRGVGPVNYSLVSRGLTLAARGGRRGVRTAVRRSSRRHHRRR